jgi:hypothetical protein
MYSLATEMIQLLLYVSIFIRLLARKLFTAWISDFFEFTIFSMFHLNLSIDSHLLPKNLG